MGSSGCGKSSVIKTLANLAEKPLRTLPVTSAMDTTDILGGFEQVGFFSVVCVYVVTTKSLKLHAAVWNSI